MRCRACAACPGWGTFYAFANVEQAMRLVGAADDNAFAEFLIIEAGVAVVPGSAFGAPGHFRLSFAASADTLKDALGRMQRALSGAKAQKARITRYQVPEIPADLLTWAGLGRQSRALKAASPIAQSVEQRTVNPWVVGSSPTRGAN